MKTICLNMIVKNEKQVIRRCLEAVKKHIDYWVIVDTGSTDGTQELIRECLKGCPGELYERPWVNFEHNRSEALDLARNKADYSFFVDADEVMHFSPFLDKNQLVKDYYLLKTIAKGQEFYFPKLIKNDPFWTWKGVLHESVEHPGPVDGEVFTDIWTQSNQDGARSKSPDTTQRDIDILKKAIEKDPEDPRPVFYLAQTYFTAKQFSEALKVYEKRSQMEGALDERFWSFFSIGQLQEFLGFDRSIYLDSYAKAYAFDPTRAEPLERMANDHLQHENPSLAYILTKHAKTLPTPLPLSSGYYPWVYQFVLDSLLADAATFLGKFDEALLVYEQIIAKKQTPETLMRHVRSQMAAIRRHLASPENQRSDIEFVALPVRLSFVSS